jgi:hypothetical protein
VPEFFEHPYVAENFWLYRPKTYLWQRPSVQSDLVFD